MATLFTCTINTSPGQGATRAAERAQILLILQRIEQEVGQGIATSNATVKDQTGAAVGSYTYTPVAAT
jgi:hypothetical protein